MAAGSIDDKGNGLMSSRFGGKQESDMLEKLGTKYQQTPDAEVQLISLGSYCGPKLTFQKIGRGAATLPFDWIRTRMEGIIHFLRHDFQNFFDFVTQQRVPDTDLMVMFRSNVSHEEVLQVPELMRELRGKFGASVRFLLILENQKQMMGPATVVEDDHVMLHYLSMDVHKKGHPENVAPYARAVESALEWCRGKIIGCHKFTSFEEAFGFVDPYPGGEKGMGGLAAFEATNVLATVEAGQTAANQDEAFRDHPLATIQNPFDYEVEKPEKLHEEAKILCLPRTVNPCGLKGEAPLNVVK